MILQHCELGYFSRVWIISQEKLHRIFMIRISTKNLTINVSLNKKVFVKLYKSSGSEARIFTSDTDQIRLGRGMRSLSARVIFHYLISLHSLY